MTIGIKQENWAVLLIIFHFGILIAPLLQGCSSVGPRVDSDVSDIVEDIARSEFLPLVERDMIPGEVGKTEMLFAEAFRLARERDPEIGASEIAYQISQIDIQQAKSSIFPRFDVEFSIEAPIAGAEFDSEKAIGAGVFLKYNLMDAAFSADAVSVQRVKADQWRQRREATTKGIYYRMIGLLCKIEAKNKEVAARTEARDIAEKALEQVRAQDDTAPVGRERADEWEVEGKRRIRELEESRLHLSLALEEFQLILGVESSANIVISDSDRLLPGVVDLESPPKDDWAVANEAWRQRNDVRVAEAELFLAEMQIIEAKRRRFPQLTFSLGLGNIILYSVDDNASIVPYLGVSCPLFDMGDAKRRIQKAERRRDIAKSNLVAIAREVVSQTRSAVTQKQIATIHLNEAQEKLEREKKHAEGEKMLHSMQRRDFPSFCRARLTELDAEIDYRQAAYEYRRAVMLLKQQKGASPPEFLELPYACPTPDSR